jgi:hypothetical protein
MRSDASGAVIGSHQTFEASCMTDLDGRTGCVWLEDASREGRPLIGRVVDLYDVWDTRPCIGDDDAFP